MNSADYVVLTHGEFLPLVNRSVQVQVCPVSINHSIVDLFRASSLRALTWQWFCRVINAVSFYETKK